MFAVLASLRRRVATPLGNVMEAADRVAAGDYAVRVSEFGMPPVRALARAFNTMTERLQSHDKLRRDLMADVAHELRTPLTVIQGKLEGLLDGVYQPDPGQLQLLLDQTHVLSRLWRICAQWRCQKAAAAAPEGADRRRPLSPATSSSHTEEMPRPAV